MGHLTKFYIAYLEKEIIITFEKFLENAQSFRCYSGSLNKEAIFAAGY